MPIIPKLPLHRYRLCFEVEDPACYQTAEDGDVCDDDGDVVFNVVDAVVDWVGPVGLERDKEAVAVRQIDFGGADCGDPTGLLDGERNVADLKHVR